MRRGDSTGIYLGSALYLLLIALLSTSSFAETRVGGISSAAAPQIRAEPTQNPQTHWGNATTYDENAVGISVAAEGGVAADEAFHYTFSRAASSIERQGVRAGSDATPTGTLSPLQAQIDLALPPNRGLTDALIRVDLAGLRQAGYEIPEISQVGRSFGMPGGGFEMQFPYSIPPEFIEVIHP